MGRVHDDGEMGRTIFRCSFVVFGLISVLVVFAASLSPLALIFAVLSYVPTSNLCLLRLTFVLSGT